MHVPQGELDSGRSGRGIGSPRGTKKAPSPESTLTFSTMKIECPHCGQRIDLGGSNPSSFGCPSCNCQITLQVSANGRSSSQGEIGHQVQQSQSTLPGQGRATKNTMAGFNLLGWLFAFIVFPLTLVKCVDKVIHKALGVDPDKYKSYLEPRGPEALPRSPWMKQPDHKATPNRP